MGSFIEKNVGNIEPVGSKQRIGANPKTVKYGTETMSHLAPKIWSLVPYDIKSSKSLDVFKSKIRQCEPDCPCRLCKNYLQHVDFIYFFIT